MFLRLSLYTVHQSSLFGFEVFAVDVGGKPAINKIIQCFSNFRTLRPSLRQICFLLSRSSKMYSFFPQNYMFFKQNIDFMWIQFKILLFIIRRPPFPEVVEDCHNRWVYLEEDKSTQMEYYVDDATKGSSSL